MSTTNRNLRTIYTHAGKMEVDPTTKEGFVAWAYNRSVSYGDVKYKLDVQTFWKVDDTRETQYYLDGCGSNSGAAIPQEVGKALEAIWKRNGQYGPFVGMRPMASIIKIVREAMPEYAKAFDAIVRTMEEAKTRNQLDNLLSALKDAHSKMTSPGVRDAVCDTEHVGGTLLDDATWAVERLIKALGQELGK